MKTTQRFSFGPVTAGVSSPTPDSLRTLVAAGQFAEALQQLAQKHAGHPAILEKFAVLQHVFRAAEADPFTATRGSKDLAVLKLLELIDEPSTPVSLSQFAVKPPITLTEASALKGRQFSPEVNDALTQVVITRRDAFPSEFRSALGKLGSLPQAIERGLTALGQWQEAISSGQHFTAADQAVKSNQLRYLMTLLISDPELVAYVPAPALGPPEAGSAPPPPRLALSVQDFQAVLQLLSEQRTEDALTLLKGRSSSREVTNALILIAGDLKETVRSFRSGTTSWDTHSAVLQKVHRELLSLVRLEQSGDAMDGPATSIRVALTATTAPSVRPEQLAAQVKTLLQNEPHTFEQVAEAIALLESHLRVDGSSTTLNELVVIKASLRGTFATPGLGDDSHQKALKAASQRVAGLRPESNEMLATSRYVEPLKKIEAPRVTFEQAERLFQAMNSGHLPLTNDFISLSARFNNLSRAKNQLPPTVVANEAAGVYFEAIRLLKEHGVTDVAIPELPGSQAQHAGFQDWFL